MKLHQSLLSFVVFSLAGCASAPPVPTMLGNAEVVSDYSSYDLRRVGFLPLRAQNAAQDVRETLETVLYTEIDAATEFELVRLTLMDLEEVPMSEPHRTGAYNPRTILALARRYRLDGILLGTVTDQQYHVPQRLGLQLDLVAAETGLAIWTGAVQLDSSRGDVKASLNAWSMTHLSESESGVHISHISPARFSRFAAWQIAQLMMRG